MNSFRIFNFQINIRVSFFPAYRIMLFPKFDDYFKSETHIDIAILHNFYMISFSFKAVILIQSEYKLVNKSLEYISDKH